jgi:hypothetical protein
MSRNRKRLYFFTSFTIFTTWALGFLLENQHLRAAPERGADCAGRRNAIVIDADAHRLLLCRDEKPEREFSVSLGKGGLDKRVTGDNRTPLGAYSLGAPRSPGATSASTVPRRGGDGWAACSTCATGRAAASR